MFRNTKDNIAFGLEREEVNRPIIEKVFGLNLEHSKYQYQHYDWVDNVRYVVVEHKSFNFPFHKSNWTLLKTSKIKNSSSLFIFEFQGGKLFYLQYSGKVFKEFQIDYVKYHNKINREEFFIIPNHFLSLFDENSKIELEWKNKNIPYIRLLIEQDKEQSKLTTHYIK